MTGTVVGTSVIVVEGRGWGLNPLFWPTLIVITCKSTGGGGVQLHFTSSLLILIPHHPVRCIMGDQKKFMHTTLSTTL